MVKLLLLVFALGFEFEFLEDKNKGIENHAFWEILLCESTLVLGIIIS